MDKKTEDNLQKLIEEIFLSNQSGRKNSCVLDDKLI